MIGERISRRSKALPAAELAPPRPHLVADEEVLRDPLDLLAVHQVEPAPPALELEEARRLGVHVGEHVVVLVQERVGRIQVLEVLHQPGAVERAVGEVRDERREPRAAQQPARVAHRVVARALVPGAAPVRHGRAVDDDRAGVLGVGGGQHHRRPPALAVADDHRLVALRMQLAHLAHELVLRRADVDQRLARLRLRIEDDEIDRMACAQRDADLRIVLEAADSRAVARARIDDHVGTLLGIHGHALRRHDAHQRIVDRPRERATVEHRFVLEMQQRQLAGALALDECIAALAQRVPEQHRALREIDAIGNRRLPQRERARRAGSATPSAGPHRPRERARRSAPAPPAGACAAGRLP